MKLEEKFSISSDLAFESILKSVLDGNRLNDNDTKKLLISNDLTSIGKAAHMLRMKFHPQQYVTYTIDRNINYTNICEIQCKFCLFHRSIKSNDAYVLARETIHEKIKATYEVGGRQILMQGGLHPDLGLDYFENLLRWMRCEFPDLHIHAFSPTEIVYLAKKEGISFQKTIDRLVNAGLNSIPGGGAEILSDRVRNQLSPKKVSADEWIEVMRTAHQIGLRTTATMVFGSIETFDDRIEHLRRIRDLQDETSGFTAFIVWPFQFTHDNASYFQYTGAFEYLKMVAIARLYLDNICNIQASWITQGEKIAQIALLMGANDLGGLMLEENVVAAAGTHHLCSLEYLEKITKEIHFELKKRDFLYNIL